MMGSDTSSRFEGTLAVAPMCTRPRKFKPAADGLCLAWNDADPVGRDPESTNRCTGGEHDLVTIEVGEKPIADPKRALQGTLSKDLTSWIPASIHAPHVEAPVTAVSGGASQSAN